MKRGVQVPFIHEIDAAYSWRSARAGSARTTEKVWPAAFTEQGRRVG